MFIRKSLILTTIAVFLLSCSKETTSPEKFGHIKGKVKKTKTNKKISGANITTTPATNSIVTSKDGSFSIKEIATGSYTIQAQKDGFKTATVEVKVRENKTATAQVFLKKDDNKISAKNLAAEVTSFSNRPINSDSIYAEVSYKVRNTSKNQKIQTYEVYFQIKTSGPSFFFETRDTSLVAGEQDIGEFEKYIRGNSIESVTVSDVFVSD